MSLQDTPRASRLHIGIFGLRNSGKSSLINAITGQRTALVSPVAGTTTDPVFKSMELHGIGPVVFIDTAGFDDPGELGQLRVERTRQAMGKTDLAILVFRGMPSAEELRWAEQLKTEKIPFLAVLNQIDQLSTQARQSAAAAIEAAVGQSPLLLSAKTGEGITQVRPALLRLLPADFDARTITGSLAKAGDVVLLVMPQDLQAPKGRLILPQVQTIRDLLDKRCCVVSCTFDTLDCSLQALRTPPNLIITDSQIFRQVWEKKPPESLLTSFSVLMAAYKGDITTFVQGAAALDNLTGESRVLIAEACTHAPLAEDIGREKIPAMLRKKYGDALQVDVVAGTDFPADLSGYDLIIHCGGCMFNRRYVLTRLEQAQRQQVPITNYGVTIAALSGILGEISLPMD